MNKQLTILAFVAACSGASAFGLSDIVNWTGTGNQKAALVVQWNDGGTPTSLVWGYRYSGSKTAADMLQDVVASDPFLFGYFGTVGQFGLPVYGLGYDSDHSGVSGAGYTHGGSAPDDAVAIGAGDRWQVGWLSNGYWDLMGTANGTNAGTWASLQTGVSQSPLEHESWRALTFASAAGGWVAPTPTGLTAAPVPEPASLLVLALGAITLRRRSR